MNKIIIHWTAGGFYPNLTDREHYHFLIDTDGRKYNGKFAPEDNINCYDGKYAQHTGGGNTNAIGVAMCGMSGFGGRQQVGKYPLSAVQCEATFKLCADLCKKYDIPITDKNIMTHYEFGLKHRNTSSCGKIDIIYLPPYPDIEQNKIGDFIRNKILWYFTKS